TGIYIENTSATAIPGNIHFIDADVESNNGRGVYVKNAHVYFTTPWFENNGIKTMGSSIEIQAASPLYASVNLFGGYFSNAGSEASRVKFLSSRVTYNEFAVRHQGGTALDANNVGSQGTFIGQFASITNALPIINDAGVEEITVGPGTGIVTPKALDSSSAAPESRPLGR